MCAKCGPPSPPNDTDRRQAWNRRVASGRPGKRRACSILSHKATAHLRKRPAGAQASQSVSPHTTTRVVNFSPNLVRKPARLPFLSMPSSLCPRPYMTCTTGKKPEFLAPYSSPALSKRPDSRLKNIFTQPIDFSHTACYNVNGENFLYLRLRQRPCIPRRNHFILSNDQNAASRGHRHGRLSLIHI